MISKEQIQAVADRLWKASVSGVTCDPVRDVLGIDDLMSAYTVQEINIQRRLAQGEQLVGCKIGLTSLAVQKQLGVDQPDFGMLTNRMCVQENEQIPVNEVMQPKAETEIAFVLAKDLLGPSITMDQIRDSIEYASPAIEVVGSRIEGWNIRITDTIADNASASHFVLGKTRSLLSELDLENCTMEMKRAGVVVSSGVGKACMGNPLNAVLWLAQTMTDLGSPLKSGDIILSGALGPVVAANPGDVFTATIQGLGEVSVSFGR